MRRRFDCWGWPILASLSLVFLLNGGFVAAELPRLKISDNQRFIVHEDGSPFFYLADTAWELFHRLNREEADRYLRDRAEKGFTVIQAVALAELNGHTDPNPYGHLPLVDLDPARPAVQAGPDNDYWDHVDYIVDKANSLGLYVGFLPTWGRYWHDEVRDGRPLFTARNAELYGEWLGRRYRDKQLIWILGGDRAVRDEADKEITRAMARGIRKGDGGRHLMTFHPRGGQGSAQYFHDEAWLDFNMRQNGHVAKFNEGYHNTRADYDRKPIKPVLDGEPIYEDHPVRFRATEEGHSIASDVRSPLYWNLFTGACGHTYGHHSVWQMWQPGRPPINNPLMPWYTAIDQPGAGQMQYGRWLIESRPMLSRVPDDSIIVAHVSDDSSLPQASGIVRARRTHIVYTRDASGKAVLYVDGVVAASGTVAGDLSNWENDFHLVLGNEWSGDRPWLGDLYHVAIHARAWNAGDVTQSMGQGPRAVQDGAILRYDFREGEGRVVRDSGAGEPLDLEVKDAAAVSWLPDGGLRITHPTQIVSARPATKLIDAVKSSRAITLEAWVTPANTVQAGPARIVTVSRDMAARNVTLGQRGDVYEARFRTTATSPNGEPAIATPGARAPSNVPVVPTAVPGAGRYRFVATRDADGAYAMVYAPVGRSFVVRMDVISGQNVAAWWYNPRNGQATAIGTFTNQGTRAFTPPDHGEMIDWILVLDDAAKGYPAPGTRRP